MSDTNWDQFTTKAENINNTKADPLDRFESRNAAPALSALEGIAGGLGDVGLEMGDLAADILSNFETTKSAGKKLKELTKGAQELNTQSDRELENPISSSIGRGVGYTAGIMLAPNKIIRGVEAGVKALPGLSTLGKAVPNFIAGGTREAATGALAGSIMTPEDRTFGALLGGGVGLPLGALGGAMSGAFKKAASDMAPAQATMKTLELDSTPAAIAAQRHALSSRGAEEVKNTVKDQAVKLAERKVNNLKPNSVEIPQKSATRLLTARVSKQFPKVEERMHQAYAPLDASKSTVDTSNLKPIIKIMDKKTKSYLPNTPGKVVIEGTLSDVSTTKATFQQLQKYRQELDISIRSAKARLAPPEVGKLKKLRSEVTTKMEQVAQDAGLSNNLKEAESIYRNEYRPFLTFSKSGKVNTVEEADSVWKEINTLLNARNPSPRKLKALITTLGDEGKDLVGWASIQNSLSKAKIGNDISLQVFNREVNKLKSSGLDTVISKPDYRKAVAGVNRIIQAGKDGSKLKTKKTTAVNFISNIVENLMETESGMKLLITLGGADKNSKVYRESIQQLFTQGVNIPVQQLAQPDTEEVNQ